MQSNRILGVLAVLCLLAPTLAHAGSIQSGQPHARQAFTERVPGTYDPSAVAAQRLALNQHLLAARVEAGIQAPLEVTVTAAELKPVLRNPLDTRKVRVGLVKPVSASLDLGQVSATSVSRGNAQRLAFGAARTSPDGFVWTGAVQAPGATALRLHFSDMNLPAGAELYVYNFQGQAFGPYTGRGTYRNGDFWSNTIYGSLLVLQIQYHGADVGSALRVTRLQLADVGYLTAKFQIAGGQPQFGAQSLTAPEVTTQSFCSFNASCVENASCSSIPSAIQPAQDADAEILFVSGAYYYVCSGGLLADTDDSSTIPYFLTAHHCISKGREANSVEAYFQYTTPCNGACYDAVGTITPVNGSSLVASGRRGDYTLLELAGSPPSGSAYLGWDSTPIANSNGAGLYRVSHPQAAPQAYSEHVVDTSAPTCSGWPRGERIYSRDTYGATEGGSSGSPVLNSSGQVVGQLSGACGTNVNDACDATNNATVDGAFAYYFASVASILDPTSGGGGGGGGGCDLGQKGDACTFDTDCCSNKCTGKPGSKSCK